MFAMRRTMVFRVMFATALLGACGGQERKVGLFQSFGDPPAGPEPALFGEGVVSTTDREHCPPAVSPDGREMVFTRQVDGVNHLMNMWWEAGAWSLPTRAPFDSDYLDDGATFTPDGSRIYFGSRRPLVPGDPQREDTDIWFVQRTDVGWSDPVRLPGPVNTPYSDSYPSFSEEGFLFFHSDRPEGRTRIFRAEWEEGAFGEPQALEAPINGAGINAAPFVHPSGEWLFFTRIGEGGLNSQQLFISFSDGSGGWSEPQDLVSLMGLEKGDLITARSSRACDCAFILAEGDVHWVDAGFLRGLKR